MSPVFHRPTYYRLGLFHKVSRNTFEDYWSVIFYRQVAPPLPPGQLTNSVNALKAQVTKHMQCINILLNFISC